jgi:bisphosphoglycerate-dependent phosphoglycerate mutase
MVLYVVQCVTLPLTFVGKTPCRQHPFAPAGDSLPSKVEMQKRGIMAQQPFNDKGSGRFEDFGKKVDERLNQAMPRVEEELKKVIAYLNDQVVPQLRQDSAQALHAAADRLRKLAQQLDDGPGSGAR